MPEQRVNILAYRPEGALVAQYLLGDGEHLIGRDINSSVYLDSKHISFQHATLHLSAKGIFIEDLNSTAGTYLDGVIVRGKIRIKTGQVLQVGDLTIDLQLESSDNVRPGSRLGQGRYTLIRLLGRGATGEVWLAKDEQLEEEVALKKLPPEFAADASALSDMRREVQKSRTLSHPNIIRIHDLYVKGGEDPFITLEYVDGRDLTHIIAAKTNGIFSWEEIKPLVLQLCNALEFAHDQKIVHRDLKPANLMVSRKGEVKLADFGIAASVADASRRSSMEGFISGTSLYMSPQQMEGETPRISDDIYAFGSTLYELLTSKPPFYTGKVEHQVLQVTPKPMHVRLQEFGIPNEIPEYADKLVMSCLAKNPEGRPQNMGAVRDWIHSEGTVKGALPNVSTEMVKKKASSGSSEEEGKPKNKVVDYAVFAVISAVVIGTGIWLTGQIDQLTETEEKTSSKTRAAAGDSNESAAVLPESLKEGLVAYYPFNGNAKDETGNGNDGNLNGVTLTSDRFGESGKAYGFDGENDFIEIGTGGVGANPHQLTQVAWIQTKDRRADYPVVILTKRHRDAVGSDWPTFGINGGYATLANDEDGIKEYVIGNSHISDGGWHQIVGVRDNQKYSVYVDGKIEKSKVVSDVLEGSDLPMRIGHHGGWGRYFKGSIDDVRIYNRALSEAEIKALYEFENPE